MQVLMLNYFTYKIVVNLVLQGSEGNETEKAEDWQHAATNDFPVHSAYTVNKMDLQYQQVGISSPFLFILTANCDLQYTQS